MIRDKQEQTLFMDFHNIETPRGKPSDIDMWYITRENFLIIGEIKNEKGHFSDFQRQMNERLIDSHKGGGTVLYIEHDKDVHKGDLEVDVAKCLVREYLWGGKWVKPQKPTTVNEAFDRLCRYSRQRRFDWGDGKEGEDDEDRSY